MSQSYLDPTELVRKYLEAAKVKKSGEKFIFRQICHSKQVFELKDLYKPISYTTVRDILLTKLEKLGLGKTRFGLYSLSQEGQRQQQILE